MRHWMRNPEGEEQDTHVPDEDPLPPDPASFPARGGGGGGLPVSKLRPEVEAQPEVPIGDIGMTLPDTGRDTRWLPPTITPEEGALHDAEKLHPEPPRLD